MRRTIARLSVTGIIVFTASQASASEGQELGDPSRAAAARFATHADADPSVPARYRTRWEGRPALDGVPWAAWASPELSGENPASSPQDAPTLPSFQVGDMVYDATTFGPDGLRRPELPPVAGMANDPTPGILYVAFEGETIRPICNNGGDTANGALNCSPLVDREVTFPPYGSGAQRDSVFQRLAGYYDAYDIVMTTNRPPDYVPYTMAVVGGTASMAGQGGGVCGIANVACDGLKRNHVSLTFPQSCGGVAEVAAQETAHNWGLEHVADRGDLLFPTTGGGVKSFKNECNPIDESTAPSQCGYIHAIYCDGDDRSQNSHAELLGVFGPRTPDTVAPKIVSVSPEPGSKFTSEDSFTVSARIEEDSNFVGLRWTWTDGAPDGELTRCTNGTCDDKFIAFADPTETSWDFLSLGPGIPGGTYTFKVEVMDAYGNSDSQEFSIEVDGPPAPSTTSGSGSGDGSGDAEDDGEDTAGDDGSDDTGGTSTGQTTGPGCACRGGTGGGAGAWFVLGAVALRRRRRRTF